MTSVNIFENTLCTLAPVPFMEMLQDFFLLTGDYKIFGRNPIKRARDTSGKNLATWPWGIMKTGVSGHGTPYSSTKYHQLGKPL